jgi:hypothetical protein
MPAMLEALAFIIQELDPITLFTDGNAIWLCDNG